MPNIVVRFGNYLRKFIYINQKYKQLQFEAKKKSIPIPFSLDLFDAQETNAK